MSTNISVGRKIILFLGGLAIQALSYLLITGTIYRIYTALFYLELTMVIIVLYNFISYRKIQYESALAAFFIAGSLNAAPLFSDPHQNHDFICPFISLEKSLHELS